MKKTTKIVALLLILTMAVCLLASCGKDPNQGSEKKNLVFGTSADYAPFEFMYPNEKGDLVYAGIDVSVAQYIADSMKLELEVENMSFENLITSLAKGDFDMVIAAMEVTDERKDAATPSDPYYTDYPAMLLVKKANADSMKTLDSLKGKTVGAQTATTKIDLVNEWEGVNAVALASVLDLVNELTYDKVDAVLLDGAVALQYAENNPEFAIAEASDEIGEALPYCVWVQKDDPKGLLPGINAAVKKMLEEKKIDQFIEEADALKDKAIE